MKTSRTLILLAISLIGVGSVQAQRVPQRALRTYIPPDQLVSFLPSTPMDTYIELVNPIFERVTGKTVIDPDGMAFEIGIPLQAMHFLDATEMVLAYNGYVLRETDQYFMVESDAPDLPDPTPPAGTTIDPATGAAVVGPATLATKQVRISAVLFELNHTKARDSGINWSVIFGEASAAAAAGGGSTSSGGGAQAGLNFFLKTDKLFEPLDDILISPSQVDLKDLKSIIQLAEASGVGETIASPEITVQSGQKGNFQSGQDIPIQKLDFSGNTVTELLQTGIIIDVTPTIITELTPDSTEVDIVHLEVSVERSSSRPSTAGPIIDRSQAGTQVVSLNGEQVMIGGLYSTDESVSRRGVPFLKDLPGWFFGLKYLFSRSQTTVSQKELLMVLQADIVEPLLTRSTQPYQEDLLERRRKQVQDALRRFNEQVQQSQEKPNRYLKESGMKDSGSK
ncbi:MAG: type II and III secretion system protein [Rhodothermales bacterium]|nr:type II and III secretion system protein [Rhodothermales bacterium]